MKTNHNLNAANALLLALGLICLPGCQSARMARPSGLGAQTTEWQVHGRAGFNFDGDFSFGPYLVQDVHRGWKKTTRFGIIIGKADLSRGWAKEQYEFTLKRSDGSQACVAQCAAGMDWKEADFDRFLGGRLEMTLMPATTLAAVFDYGTNAPAWKLAAGQKGEDMTLSGVLSDGSRTISVRGTRALEGTPIALTEASGYVFYLGQKSVGAVDVVNEGSVMADPSLPPDLRDALCAASAALLLYRELK